MPSTVSVLWFICGLVMFWLCFRILLDQFSAPDEPQAQAHVDGHGEALTDKDHELVQAADETHHQHRLEEETMALEFWDRGK
jgi:ABC-type nickel/cobalt efflux system permease component RcnA